MNKAPFVIYADFESILESMSTCLNDTEIPCTNHINKHTPSGFCTYNTVAYGIVQNQLKLYRGKECVRGILQAYERGGWKVVQRFSRKADDSSYS